MSDLIGRFFCIKKCVQMALFRWILIDFGRPFHNGYKSTQHIEDTH